MDLDQVVRRWWATAVTAAGVALAGVTQAVYQSRDGAAPETGWLVASIVFAVVAAVAPGLDTQLRRRREQAVERLIAEARQGAVVALNDGLDPLVETLGELAAANSADRPAVLRKLITQALNSAAQIIGPERTRVSFFHVLARRRPQRIVCDNNSAGRAGRVQTVFERGRPDGDFVFGLLEKDQPYFCEDVRTQPPPGWDASRGRDYRTFISVPARVGGRSMGMVTADAPEVGDLNEQHESLLRVFGTVIAASMMLTEDED
jgi:hypothetical protein